MEQTAYPDVYGLWTNKGGVGKTTLSYHMCNTYAELFPNKAVVAIDMCPQANLSSTLLTNVAGGAEINRDGPKKVQMLHDSTLVSSIYPKTVGGFLINYTQLKQGRIIDPEEWLVNVKSGVRGPRKQLFDGNNQMPDNLYLMCGDSCLDLLVARLTTLAADETTDEGLVPPYKIVRMVLQEYIQDLAKYFKKQGKELVVFIDTNPALSIYTQIALVAMTELIIPVNADCFSMQAVKNMFHLVYGMYPSSGLAAKFEESTFAAKAKKHNIPLPRISAIVHNKTPVHREAAADGGNFQRPRVYRELADSHAGLLFEAYKTARAAGDLDRVFLPRTEAGFTDTQLLGFSAAYTGTMRDMATCGVVSMSTGVPLWRMTMDTNRRHIGRAFNTRDTTSRLPYLLNDMLVMMQNVFGNVMNDADPAARARMDALAAPARLHGDNNAPAAGGAAAAADAASDQAAAAGDATDAEPAQEYADEDDGNEDSSDEDGDDDDGDEFQAAAAAAHGATGAGSTQGADATLPFNITAGSAAPAAGAAGPSIGSGSSNSSTSSEPPVQKAENAPDSKTVTAAQAATNTAFARTPTPASRAAAQKRRKLS